MTQQGNQTRVSVFFTLLTLFFIILFSQADQGLLPPFYDVLLLRFFGALTEESLVRKLTTIQSVFVAISGVAMIIAGIFSDRTSRKWICFSGTMLYGIVSIITYFTPLGELGYIFFFITRCLNGIGIGTIIPTVFSMVGDLVKAEKRTMSFAYISVGLAVGQLVGMILGGLLANRFYYGPQWNLGYLITGTLSTIAGLTVIAIKEPKRGAMETELQDMGEAQYVFKLQKGDFRRMFTNRTNFWLIINFIDTIPSGIIFSLIFLYLLNIHKIPESLATILILLAFIVSIIGTLVFGKIGDVTYRKNRKSKVLIALLCNGVPIVTFLVFLLVPFTLPEDPTIVDLFTNPMGIIGIVAVVLTQGINKGVEPNWFSTLADVNLPENRATMISLAQTLDLVGLSIGPLIGGWVVDIVNNTYSSTTLGLQAAMWVACGFWFLNIFLWLPIFFNIEKDLDDVHGILQQRAREIQKQ
jgi:MFS family permease